MPALRPPSCVVECYIQGGPAPPSPKVSLKPRRRGPCRSLVADDVPGPGLVLGPWCQVGDDHLHSLQLLILGRDRAHLIGDLVAFHRNILPFYTAGEKGAVVRAEEMAQVSKYLPCKREYLSSDPQHPCKTARYGGVYLPSAGEAERQGQEDLQCWLAS